MSQRTNVFHVLAYFNAAEVRELLESHMIDISSYAFVRHEHGNFPHYHIFIETRCVGVTVCDWICNYKKIRGFSAETYVTFVCRVKDCFDYAVNGATLPVVNFGFAEKYCR